MTGTIITDDVAIIDEILKGNKEKYELLMRKYNTSLYRIAKGILAGEQEIEDAMQEAYIKAYRQLANFERRATFKTWLTRILLNECLMKKRQGKRATIELPETFAEHSAERNTPENKMMNKELMHALENAISSLPEKYRVVFLMREVEQMSIAETTDVLDISEGNVKARLSRAKEMLRNQLMAQYPPSHLFEFNAVRCNRIVQNVFAMI